MAALTSTYSLVEQAKRIDPSGQQALIAEVLNRKTGMILTEAPWMPSNDVWTNKTTRRASLPTGSRRRLNQRISQSVSRTTEVMDVIEQLEDYCDVDAALVESMPSPAMFRAGEVDAFIEGLGQTMVSDMLYGDANVDPDSMHGLAARMGTLDGRFVITGGGAGSEVSSCYVVTWGQTSAYLIYPKNMAATLGVQHNDKGQVTSETTAGLIEVYRDHFVIRCGLVIRDPRAIGRYANIESAGATNTFDEDNLIKLINNMNTGPGTRIYVNEVILTQMQIRMKDKNNVYFTPGGNALSGEPPLYFAQVPVRQLSQEILTITEDAIN
ncbi:MAG: major capsid protein [Pseudomonadota bacterium]